MEFASYEQFRGRSTSKALIAALALAAALLFFPRLLHAAPPVSEARTTPPANVILASLPKPLSPPKPPAPEAARP